MDALSQLIEPFVSLRANPITDALCRDGITRIARSIRIAFEDGKNISARTDMALGSLYGGIALANAGLGAVHGFAAPIGGSFTAPHGAVCAALLAPVMEINMAALAVRGQNAPVLKMWEQSGPKLNRYEMLACLLTHRTEATVADGVAWLRQLAKDLNIPPLRTYGMTEADIPALCEKAVTASSMKANPIVLTKEELAAILKSAL
jgi:alcohol dehydrogenase class IV